MPILKISSGEQPYFKIAIRARHAQFRGVLIRLFIQAFALISKFEERALFAGIFHDHDIDPACEA